MLSLSKVQDFRSPLAKLTRKELEYLARKEGRQDIEPGMPAELMRICFTQKPPSQLPRPMRKGLGAQSQLRVPPYEDWLKVAFYNGHFEEPKPQVVEEVAAENDLIRQWQEQKKPANEMAELRKAVKANGITAPRTATKDDLRALLDG